MSNNNPETTGASAEVLTIPKTPEDVPPLMSESAETSEMADEKCEAPPPPPQRDLPDDIIQPDPEITDSPGEENACGLSETPVSVPDEDNSSPMMTEVGQSRAARLTFHFLTGNHIRLCSSDTVALRYESYNEGLVVASQPIQRGMSFRIRVDKISNDWEGTLGIGALAMLPTVTPPLTALYFTIPCWVVTEEILYGGGIYTLSDRGRGLDDINENSVLTLRFRENSYLTLEIDGKYSCIIDSIPPLYNDIYPVIDVYGKVVQVSILQPPVIIRSTSPDLTMTEEKQEASLDEDLTDVGPHADSDPKGNSREDSYPDLDNPLSTDDSKMISGDSMINLAINSLSLGSHILDDDSDSDSDPEGHSRGDPYPYHNTTGDLVINDDYTSSSDDPDEDYSYNSHGRNRAADCDTHSDDEDKSDNSGDESNSIDSSSNSIDETYPLVEVLEYAYEQYEPIPGPSSTPEKPQGSDNQLSEDPSSGYSMINPLSLGSHILDDDSDSLDEIEETCDSDISHNDIYPEANELYDSCQDNDGFKVSDKNDDDLDNVFMDAMFLEMNNMPDLDEEQSLSFNDSTTTRSDDYYDDFEIENLRYLNSILNPDQREIAARIDHPDRVIFPETNENCEVMHVVLKFWDQIVAPYPDLHDVVTSGIIHCFCHDCDPDADAVQSGWVRIERAKPEEPPPVQPHRMFWPVLQAMITSAPAINDTNVDMRRPRFLFCTPPMVPSCVDTWFDEEGNPHVTALGLDIDVGGQEPQDDRLLAYWIYVRTHASIQQEVSSIEEDSEDSVGDAVDDIELDTVEDIDEDAVDDIETLLDDDKETIEEFAVAVIIATANLDEVQSETDSQIGDVEE